MGQRQLFIYDLFSKYLVLLYIKLFFHIIWRYLQTVLLIGVEKLEEQYFVLRTGILGMMKSMQVSGSLQTLEAGFITERLP